MTMELSRSEYPGIVTSVTPSPAIRILKERLLKGGALNLEIAQWLEERRKIEDAYAQGLNKLVKRPVPGDNSDLGIFAAPWARIVDSTSVLAVAHQDFAHKLDLEVERPIREFTSKNQEWSGMKNMEANLSAVAKTIESAEERQERLRKRGPKAKPQQVAEAATAVSNALTEWESQAPFVFEKLQAADESRCNNLRDALTRWQTLELDQAQSEMQAAESTLGSLLDVNPSDEIKAFVNKCTTGRQPLERHLTGNRTATPGTGAPPAPSIVTDDSISVQSSGSGGGSAGAPGHSSSGLGLRRLGTVLRNRSNRNSIFHRSSSPDRRLDRNMRGIPPMPPSPNIPRAGDSPQPGSNSLAIPSSSPPPTANAKDAPLPILPQQNGDSHPAPSSPTTSTAPAAPSLTVTSAEPEKDSEGFSIPPPDLHRDIGAISEEDQEEHQPQFKVEIKNDVIHEEEDEADAALSKVANTLRAQNTVSQKRRGRRDARDVRNTMFIPNPPPELTAHLPGSPPLTPLNTTPKPSTVASEAGSDTVSIKSSRSIMSLPGHLIRHPELTEPGLSASLVESVSMTFEGGQATKTLVAGEIALGYNLRDDGDSATSETLRIENFAVLEKVAPNPAFIQALPDRAGEYTVSLNNIHKTSVGFKYQVHVDETASSAFGPIIITPAWRIEPHQSSVIVHWKPNPNFRRLNGVRTPLTLRNVIFITGVDGAATSSCQSKPMGTFSKEKGRLAWKLGDLTVDPDAADGGKVLARFATDGIARPTPVEARWEISGEGSENVGSDLTLSISTGEATKSEEEEADPFADTIGEEKSPNSADFSQWKALDTVRKVISGKYTAV